MRILACGGAGYIGAHVACLMLERGHEVVVYDNLGNGSALMVERAGELARRPLPLVVGDVRDEVRLNDTLAAGRYDCVLHFAALKSVGESVVDPMRYYDNNVGGTLALLRCMQRADVRNLVFSSTATVYSPGAPIPFTEEAPLDPINPYGNSKRIAEYAMRDLCRAWPDFRAISLRYFNPAGAHPSGRIGEDPRGVSDNLMPIIARAAAGLLPEVRIFGGDYPTPDGTGVRDYLHVMDLAEGHAAAVDALGALAAGWHVFNLGRGEGYSVRQMLDCFTRVNGVAVPQRVVARREGDMPAYWADATRAGRVLNWRATRQLEDICRDAWRWQQQQEHP